MASYSGHILITCGCFLTLGSMVLGLGDDVVAAVQASAQIHRQQANAQASMGLALDRAQVLASLAVKQLPAPMDLNKATYLLTRPFNCTRHPKMCREPFNCQTFTMLELAPAVLQGVAASGKANLRTWCAAPQYEDYATACLVEKDLVKAGQIQLAWSMKQHNGVDEMDGSYCFIEGHCTNTAVTNATTLEESYQMCDHRYGHKTWTSYGRLNTIAGQLLKMPGPNDDMRAGFRDPALTKYFLLAACSMGNYHCDVVYCKETYCKDKHYVEKYKHLEPKAPGHLIQQRDWLF